MTEDPEQESHDPFEEGEPHEAESDLIHVELGEAVAAARTPTSAAKRRQRKPTTRPRRAAMALLHIENLPSDQGSSNGPIVVWIILQLAAIAASAVRWKFWATEGIGNAHSIELLTLHLLLIVQIVVSTLIYPILLDGWSKLAWAVAAVVAFDAVGSVMTSVRPISAVWAGGFVVLWIVGLAAWRAAVRGAVGTMLIRLVLVLVVLGDPIVMYLHGEFATGSGGGAGWNFGGPLLVGVRQLDQPGLVLQTWAIVAVLTGCGGVVLLWRLGIAKWHRRRRARVVQ